jgi:hypothetical protein
VRHLGETIRVLILIFGRRSKSLAIGSLGIFRGLRLALPPEYGHQLTVSRSALRKDAGASFAQAV